jgi:hypothetical protein
MISKKDIITGAVLRLMNGDTVRVKSMDAEGKVALEYETRAPKVETYTPGSAAYLRIDAPVSTKLAEAQEENIEKKPIEATVTCGWIELANATLLTNE